LVIKKGGRIWQKELRNGLKMLIIVKERKTGD
jgi:hypothetical protein